MSSTPPCARSLLAAFDLPDRPYVFLIGGGGKTSLMFALAKALSDAGHSVVTTTSTKIYYPDPRICNRVIIEDSVPSLADRLRVELAASRHVTVGKVLLAGGTKIGGFSADELDVLRDTGVAQCWLVEADGAAGRSLKAHRDYEPVVSQNADLVIAVIGIDCLGKPLTQEHVHHSGDFRLLLGRPEGAPIALQDITGVFFHPRGYLKNVGPRTSVSVFISKAGSPADQQHAQRLAAALSASDTHNRIGRILIGSEKGECPLLVFC